MATLPWQELQSAQDLMRVRRFVQSSNITWIGKKNLKKRFIQDFHYFTWQKKGVKSLESMDHMLTLPSHFQVELSDVPDEGHATTMSLQCSCQTT